MAIGKKKTKTEVKMVETKVEVPDGVTLELSQEEADFLYQLLMNMGGDPAGPRKNVDSICNGLSTIASIGAEWPALNTTAYVDGRRKPVGSIYVEKIEKENKE